MNPFEIAMLQAEQKLGDLRHALLKVAKLAYKIDGPHYQNALVTGTLLGLYHFLNGVQNDKGTRSSDS